MIGIYFFITIIIFCLVLGSKVKSDIYSNFFRTYYLFGLGILKGRNLKQLLNLECDFNEFLLDLASKKISNLENIRSQILQDIFVLNTLNWKKFGFFVEFGAADGVYLSNTYLLEKEFSWSGILAEPARVWHSRLHECRNAAISHNCVWIETGKEIRFFESKIPAHSSASFPSIIKKIFLNNNIKKSYLVPTIELNDLLSLYNAPCKIDYISIDVEGAEFEILNKFNFNKYKVSVITCEHNFNSSRGRLVDLLESKGFIQIYKGLSRWESWFINPDNIAML